MDGLQRYIQRSSQRGEVINHIIVDGIWFGIRRTACTPFIGTSDKGSIVTPAFGRIQIEVMAGHHANLGRFQLQILRNRVVGFGQYFLLSNSFAGKHCIP